jgi:hypothetical protein
LIKDKFSTLHEVTCSPMVGWSSGTLPIRVQF